MANIFKVFISDKIVEEKLRDRYGKDYKLEIEMNYQHRYKSTKIDVGFTHDNKAYWILKYKGDFYMNVIEDIELKDKYTVIDIYTTLVENAIDTYNHISGMQREKRKVLRRKKK